MGATGVSSRLPKMTDEERADLLQQRADRGRAQRRARDEEADRELRAALDAPWLHGPKEGRNSYGKLVVRSTVTIRREAPANMTRKRQPDPHEAGCAPTVRDPDPAEIADEEERRRPPPGAGRVKGALVHYSMRFPEPYREGSYQGINSKGRVLVQPKGDGEILCVKSDRVKFVDEEAAARRVAKSAARTAVAAMPTVAALLDAAAPVMRSSESTRIGREHPIDEILRRHTRPIRKSPSPVRYGVFLAFVKRKPCRFCEWPGPSDPHHFGPRGHGQKTSDLRTLPLCRSNPAIDRVGHHDYFHAEGALPGMTPIDTKAWINEAILELHDEFFGAWILDGEPPAAGDLLVEALESAGDPL